MKSTQSAWSTRFREEGDFFEFFLFLWSIGSPIFCHGRLLHTVQMAQLFRDSKTFVDKKLRFHPDVVLVEFERLMDDTGGRPTRDNLTRFVADCFDNEGSEFEHWHPSDWVESPAFLQQIHDAQLKEWGLELHGAWKSLGRKIKGAFFVRHFLRRRIFGLMKC